MAEPAIRWTLLIAFCAVATALTVQSLSLIAPPASWWPIIQGHYPNAVDELIFTQVALPRITVSWLVGAALGLAGLLFQQVLRNPLADPATIGVSSGAYLALAAVSLFAPHWLESGSEIVALSGGAAACALVMAVARKSQFATINIILAGLIVSLFCGAAASTLMVLNHEYLSGLFIWQTGSLAQNGWHNTLYLLPKFSLLAVCAILLVRPLTLLMLDDARVASLGISVSRLRVGAILIGVALSAISVSAVGVIGFIGLMAPNLARMLGARTLPQRMLMAPLLGALLLWLTDQIVQNLLPNSIPTGSAAALVGAPLLLWLLFRQKIELGSRPNVTAPASVRLQRALNPRGILAICGLAWMGCMLIALGVGRNAAGWTGFSETALITIMDWRVPRVLAAGVAGGMLAMAGTLLQRITGNPLASPEVLGVSSGASLGVIALLLLTSDLDQRGMLMAASAGALATLAMIIALNWRSSFSPERLLLAGIALSTLFSACAAYLLISGDPRAAALLTWMSGSTYRVTAESIVPGCILLAVGYVSALAGTRWLAILPLGSEAAQAVGVNVIMARVYFLAIIAVVTGSATILVGPLSFVGLLAPHIVVGLGLTRPRAQLAGSILAGSAIMVMADWVGRTIVFPWQVPAGLIAMLIGGPAFLWFLWRSR